MSLQDKVPYYLLQPGHRYLSLVGSLLWASVTRPDIAVAVGIACTQSKSPTKADLVRAIRILRYLLHTPHIKLTLKRPTTATRHITVYVDSAWCNAPKTRLRYGYLVCIYGCPVFWLGNEIDHVSVSEHSRIRVCHSSASD